MKFSLPRQLPLLTHHILHLLLRYSFPLLPRLRPLLVQPLCYFLSILQNEYHPDSVSSPGETLLETLETIGMSQVELAKRMGRPVKTINEIIQKKATITAETALQLEQVLHIPASFWLQLEQHYREFLARLAEEQCLTSWVEWLHEFPIRDMMRRGWIPACTNKPQQVLETLKFFEAGHILRHGKRQVFLEIDQKDRKEAEDQANTFAANMLIDPVQWQQFVAHDTSCTKVGIKEFAQEVGIAPGIVVGRLQHEKCLPFDHCNDLKRRLEWND